MIFEHKSVLLMETVDSLNVKPDGIYVDGTLGGGGHAYEVSRRLGEKGRLIGIDQDADAIAAATERLLPFKDKVTIVRSNYKNIREVLFNLGIEKVDGIYLDLGVSSYQLDTADRGFSYREDAPLDMRMDQRNDKTAADIVNAYRERAGDPPDRDDTAARGDHPRCDPCKDPRRGRTSGKTDISGDPHRTEP